AVDSGAAEQGERRERKENLVGDQVAGRRGVVVQLLTACRGSAPRACPAASPRPAAFHLRRKHELACSGPSPTDDPPDSTASSGRRAGPRVRNFQSGRESIAALGDRWPPSSGAPGGFSLRPVPDLSSTPARSSGNEWAARAAASRAGDATATLGTAKSCAFGSGPPLPVSATPRPPASSPPAPNKRADARAGDEVISHSVP